MKYAQTLANAGECADPRVAGELAALAEQAGWDGICLEDYIVYTNGTYFSTPGSPTHDPWVMLAAMAMRTQRVLLGTSVTPLPRRRPWKLAREAVSLDHLSSGRLVLGVGIGDASDPSFARFDEEPDARVRAEMLDESLQIVAGLWSGKPFSFEGKHYTVGGGHLFAQAGADAAYPNLGRRGVSEEGTGAASGALGWRDALQAAN